MRTILFSIFSCIFCFSLLQAQSPDSTQIVSLEEITIEAAVQPDEVFQKVAALDLHLRGLPSAQEALTFVPGLFVAQHAGGGKAEQIFLRGFDLDHGTDIALTVDGLPVNMVSHAHGQGYSDLHFLIPELIEQIDFQKGPFDAGVGNFGTTGAVNFQTYDALEQSRVSLEGGQFGLMRGLAMVDLNPGQAAHDAYFAAEYQRMQGYFESPQDFSRLNLWGRYHGLLGDSDELTLTLSSFGSSWDASGQIPVRAVEQGLISRWGAIDDTEGGQTHRQQLSLRHQHRSPKPGQSFQQQAYLAHYDFTLFSNFTFFLEDPDKGDQIRQAENRWLLGYQNQFQTVANWRGKNLRFLTGLQFRQDLSNDNELSRTLQRTQIRERLAYGNVAESNLSLFAQNQLQLSPRWQLETGLRLDLFRFSYQNLLENTPDTYPSLVKGQISPHLQISWQASERGQYYFKLGKGFHSNDSRQIMARQGGKILPSAYGADLGWLGKPFSRLLLHTTLWSLYLDEELIYVGDAGIVEPAGQTFRYGFELSLRYQINDQLFFDTDWNYTIAQSLGMDKGENFLPLAPKFSSTGGLNYFPNQRWKGSLRYRWLGDRPANEDYSLTAEGYFLLDAKLSYCWKHWEMSLTAQNLLNADWREAQFETESRLRHETAPVSEIHFTPGAPFFARLGLSYSW